MATKLTKLSAAKKGWKESESFAELELNQVSFPFTGRIEAQTPLMAGFTGEVGMILVVDKWNKTEDKVNPIVRPMLETGEKDEALFCLNYSSEESHDERARGLRYFHQVRGTDSCDWLGLGEQCEIYPRLGYLSVGERFTTSAITVTEDTCADFEAAQDNYFGKLFCADIDGYWKETTKLDVLGPVVKVVDPKLGMPDGSYGFKVEVVKA